MYDSRVFDRFPKIVCLVTGLETASLASHNNVVKLQSWSIAFQLVVFSFTFYFIYTVTYFTALKSSHHFITIY